MTIFQTVDEMRRASQAAKNAGKHIGLVPTMGALHNGHLSLVRTAKAKSDFVAVSIFVNPTQFGPQEDLARYPRTFERDCEMLEGEGVDLVFAPSVEEMYPENATTFVNVEGLSEKLCGRSRPGHFRGVTTVVAKLFNVVQPDSAFFGQKDAAQCAIIRRMVGELNVPVEIIVCPIVREPDGLAMSSRNLYLSPIQRKDAVQLHLALERVVSTFLQGERLSVRLLAEGAKTISQAPELLLDYFDIVDPDSLDPLARIDRPALVAVAAFAGATRLIDNTVLNPTP